MKNSWIIVLGLLGLCCCLAVIVFSVIFGVSLWSLSNSGESLGYETTPILPPTRIAPPSSTPRLVRPTQTLPLAETPPPSTLGPPSETPQITPTLVALTDTLSILDQTLVPINNLIDLAERLEGKTNLPISLEAPPPLLQIGDKESFWVTDSDTNENTQIPATLGYITEHVYFWIQDGVQYNKQDLKRLVDTFEHKIYPTNREFFGSEWTPGVDNDPHLYILYTRGMGGNVAGYYSPADEYLPMVREDSNGHEMFFLSADHVLLDEEFAYSVLAHEFQHMIHWYRDRNEETWVNEGFSNLAALLNGYDEGGSDYFYVSNPDMQLNDWPDAPDERAAHYGASFLFMTYFLDRFGENATQAVVTDDANGLPGMDEVLAALQITDPLSGKTVTANDVFADWVIASYLNDPDVGDGRFTYTNYPGVPQTSATEEFRSCPRQPDMRQVSQYGVDYIRIRCNGSYTLNFEGSVEVNVLPADPHSGTYAFYSNRGDESDMTLTRSFDFTNHSGPLTFTYWTWYDLEKDYDYLYLLASLDGKTWQFLFPPSGTAEDPSGNSYGWGYNGLSGGSPEWIEESVDISQFAGKQVWLRFEYITDAAVNGEGFLLDDVSIPEIEYATDFETDDGGWQAGGFVRIQNTLPQFFRLSLISIGQTTTVSSIVLSADNAANIPLTIGNGVREVILVVSGVTRFTRQKAVYQYSIQP